MRTESVNVAIVGGGIVGATLACLLAEKSPSITISLIDAGTETALYDASFDPRVVALSPKSQEILTSIDVWQDVLRQRHCAYQDMYVWDLEGTGKIHFSGRDIHLQDLGHIVENSVVLHALYQKIATLPNISLRRSTKVASAKCDAQNRHTLIAFDGGETLQASLVIAADGAKSALRQQAGFTTREWDYHHSAIVTTVETELPHQHTAWQCFSIHGPLAFLPLEKNAPFNHEKKKHYSSIVWSLATEKAEEMMALDDEHFCEQLDFYFQQRLGKVKSTDKRYVFPLRQRHSKNYYQDGIVLLGDAAHTVHPLAGQGANLGLYDAHVLATELARAHTRELSLNDASVLSRYERQRQPHNLLAMATMEGFKQLFGSDQLIVRWLRNTGLNVFNQNSWLKSKLIRLASGR